MPMSTSYLFPRGIEHTRMSSSSLSSGRQFKVPVFQHNRAEIKQQSDALMRGIHAIDNAPHPESSASSSAPASASESGFSSEGRAGLPDEDAELDFDALNRSAFKSATTVNMAKSRRDLNNSFALEHATSLSDLASRIIQSTESDDKTDDMRRRALILRIQVGEWIRKPPSDLRTDTLELLQRSLELYDSIDQDD